MFKVNTVLLLLALSSATALAQLPPPRETGIKYFRDSAEYAALARQVYRVASERVAESAKGLRGGSWAVILDIDETALDNSTYQLERAAYSLPYESESWIAWVKREQAAAIPGVRDFVIS